MTATISQIIRQTCSCSCG